MRLKKIQNAPCYNIWNDIRTADERGDNTSLSSLVSLFSIVTAGSSRFFATSCLTLLWAAWWPSVLSPTYPGSRTTWTSWSVLIGPTLPSYINAENRNTSPETLDQYIMNVIPIHRNWEEKLPFYIKFYSESVCCYSRLIDVVVSIDYLTSVFFCSAGFPLQGQPPVSGLQLPAALCAGLLCLSYHPQGEPTYVLPFNHYFHTIISI